MRNDRHAGGHDALNRIHIFVGDRRQPVPSAVENAHDPAGFQNLDVAAFFHRVTKEEVTGKHRHLHEVRFAVAPRAHAHLGKERGKTFGDQLLSHTALLIAVVEDGRAVLGSGIIALAVHRCGVVDREEDLEDFAIAGNFWIERHLYHFDVPGASGTDGTVVGVRQQATHVSRFHGGHALHLVVHRFETPEASAAERCDFLSRHTFIVRVQGFTNTEL